MPSGNPLGNSRQVPLSVSALTFRLPEKRRSVDFTLPATRARWTYQIGVSTRTGGRMPSSTRDEGGSTSTTDERVSPAEAEPGNPNYSLSAPNRSRSPKRVAFRFFGRSAANIFHGLFEIHLSDTVACQKGLPIKRYLKYVNSETIVV